MHTGTSSGVYTQTTEVGNVTAAAVSNLATGKTYYFVVTAYNNGRVDGPPSNEVSFVAGSTPTPTPSVTPTATPTPSATVDTPTISPASGTFKKRVTIRFSCTTAGATIYYTLDGSNPTTASAAYFIGKRKSKGIRIVGVGSHTVKAKAAMNGYNDSAIATANLTLY